jgi:signal transduction histidine kinase
MCHPAWLSSLLFVAGLPVIDDLFSDPAAEIRQEIQKIDVELALLAPARTTPTVATLGYLSEYWKSSDVSFPIDINLRSTARLDTLMILPVAALDERNVAKSFQFPLRFTLELIAVDGTSRMIADYSQTDYPTPGLEPQIFRCPPYAEVQTIRFTALRLRKNPRAITANYFMALGEIFAFAGEQNVALNAEVQAASATSVPLSWSPFYLVDGFTNFVPVVPDVSSPFLRRLTVSDELFVTLDLGKNVIIDEIRIWPLDVSSNHSHTSSQGQGFPLSLELETALRPDFSDAQLVFSDARFPRPNIAPLSRTVTPTMSRYVRLTARDGYRFPGDSGTGIGLTEIELFQEGKLLTRSISQEIRADGNSTISKLLTDGFSRTGRIRPLKNCMLQIARRSVLEERRADLTLALDAVHTRQSALLGWAGTLLAGLVGIFILLYFISRYRNEKRLYRMRDEIACDLHDEVGANISSIAGTAEILQETFPYATAKQRKLFGDIIGTARRTAGETNRLIQFLERGGMDGDLILQMESTARQLLPDTEHQCHWHNAEAFNGLLSVQKWDLLLFFKECLHNIVKHSQATAVTIEGSAAKGTLTLSVHDNGTGISDKTLAPAHLKRRARKLKGRMSVQTSAENGTTVLLNMKIPNSYPV